MNILTFNSRELDVIYDALVMHMNCADDNVTDTCHAIINNIHMYSIMNDDV
jgi:hypothetical protein